MANDAARLLIGGTGSGCGKTTVTSAVLRALARRGEKLHAFKCGPDYIDPMFHTAAIGVPSRNLDLFFVKGKTARAMLADCIPAGGVGVVEGAMGFYDGVSGDTDEASAAHLARETETPAVLVARPRGQSLSLAAELSGFRTFGENTLAGVVLNDVSRAMYPYYKKIAEKAGLRVFGHLPPVAEAAIPDRHLGLVTAGEIEDLQRKLDLLADAAESCIDLDGLVALAHRAPPLMDKLETPPPVTAGAVRIAVARDEAFCFYYEDNFDLLRAMGATLVFFSPLRDRALPAGADGLYLGGGYPELHADALQKNKSMRESVRRAVAGGLPTVAECGGFLYLHQTLCGREMAGALCGAADMTARLQPFGYVTLYAARDNLLCPAGGQIRAHEFHYAASGLAGDGFTARKPNGRAWPSAVSSPTLYAGFPHLYFRSNPLFAENFIRRCAGMEAKR